MMAASRAGETPGAPRGQNRKTRPSGIRTSVFPSLKRRRGVPGKGRTTWRNRKAETMRTNRDKRTTREEKRRWNREPQNPESDEAKNPTRSGAAWDS
ncbi:hypothetical protein NDU88_003651 [Pleurodeles waltl]|uniref:Uncharacterized protein n=1 Tax=Pleurodeles waltl TaxID=8319 RepID=A0AAV7PA82_PLEWA|nr:hypothetical protein NDU88_003651 [Pleurodeles waltl]